MTVENQIPQYIVIEKEKNGWKKAIIAFCALAIGGIIIFCAPHISAHFWKEEVHVSDVLPGPANDPVSWEGFYCGFSMGGLPESRLREIHATLNEAIRKMGISFGESVSNVEVAAFLGQVSHESDYLKAKREYCSLPEYGSTCLEDYQYGSWCPGVQPAPGKYYYGRGYMQLTWNCNYDAAGRGLNRDLLANPDQVETSDQIAWETALWFWNANGCASPARSGQFGQTTRLINSMECNGGNNGAQQSRIDRYQNYRKCIGLPLESDGGKLWC